MSVMPQKEAPEWNTQLRNVEQTALEREDHRERIAYRPFAGRLGGNQDFAVSERDPDAQKILEQTPDAGLFLTWRDSLDLRGFRNIELYKSAFIEAWGKLPPLLIGVAYDFLGTCMLTFTTGILSVGLGAVGAELSTGALVPSIIGGVSNAIFLALFIFSAGTVSGGHLNPMITMAVFLTRLATLPRTVIYVVAQSIGGIIGALLIRAALGTKSFAIGGCTWNTQTMTQGEAFALEATMAMTLLFLVYGVGLDPRQKEVFGPALSPLLVGLSLGICTFATGVARVGYSGVSLNPARCFGSFVATGFPSYHWVHWVGPFTGAVINSIFYNVVPPFAKSR